MEHQTELSFNILFQTLSSQSWNLIGLQQHSGSNTSNILLQEDKIYQLQMFNRLSVVLMIFLMDVAIHWMQDVSHSFYRNFFTNYFQKVHVNLRMQLLVTQLLCKQQWKNYSVELSDKTKVKFQTSSSFKYNFVDAWQGSSWDVDLSSKSFQFLPLIICSTSSYHVSQKYLIQKPEFMLRYLGCLICRVVNVTSK